MIPNPRRKLLGYLVIVIMGFILSRYIAARIKADLRRNQGETHQDRKPGQDGKSP